jgi:hypothetical protein
MKQHCFEHPDSQLFTVLKLIITPYSSIKG